MMTLPDNKYMSDEYLRDNPSWDSEDSPWKAAFVPKILNGVELIPKSICEVGCGAGGVLAELRKIYPNTELFGWDIAPSAEGFWEKHQNARINFTVGDFLALNTRKFDVILLLDVIEHVADPFEFLSRLRGNANYYIFHFPLDLSATSILRERPILEARKKVGHIHYFTKSLALSLISECGYDVKDWWYSGAAFNGPRRNWKTILASFPRRLAYALNQDWGVRALGGETLYILAKNV